MGKSEAGWELQCPRKPFELRQRDGGIELRTRWYDGSVALVGVQGHIDAANRDIFLNYLLTKIVLSQRVILDLSTVRFFSIDAFHSLQTAVQRSIAAGVPCVALPSPAVQRVLRLCDPANQIAAVALGSDAAEQYRALPKATR